MIPFSNESNNESIEDLGLDAGLGLAAGFDDFFAGLFVDEVKDPRPPDVLGFFFALLSPTSFLKSKKKHLRKKCVLELKKMVKIRL